MHLAYAYCSNIEAGYLVFSHQTVRPLCSRNSEKHWSWQSFSADPTRGNISDVSNLHCQPTRVLWNQKNSSGYYKSI